MTQRCASLEHRHTLAVGRERRQRQFGMSDTGAVLKHRCIASRCARQCGHLRRAALDSAAALKHTMQGVCPRYRRRSVLIPRRVDERLDASRHLDLTRQGEASAVIGRQPKRVGRTASGAQVHLVAHIGHRDGDIGRKNCPRHAAIGRIFQRGRIVGLCSRASQLNRRCGQSRDGQRMATLDGLGLDVRWPIIVVGHRLDGRGGIDGEGLGVERAVGGRWLRAVHRIADRGVGQLSRNRYRAASVPIGARHAHGGRIDEHGPTRRDVGFVMNFWQRGVFDERAIGRNATHPVNEGEGWPARHTHADVGQCRKPFKQGALWLLK